MIDAKTSSLLLDRVRELHDQVRAKILAHRFEAGEQGWARPQRFEGGDTLYSLDTHVEPLLIEWAERLARDVSLTLIAEGIGERAFQGGSGPSIRVIIDPVDGTRGLMYDKRSAWCLTGIAPDRGESTTLADIELAVQSEIPISKQAQYDVLYCRRGEGAHGQRFTLGDPDPKPLEFGASQAPTLAHGFGMISNFFPGTKRESADLMETIASSTLDERAGFVPIFDDQYISSAGQLYELMVGHDRFNADFRPLFYRIRGEDIGLSCHPYDLCTELIAREAGVWVTDGFGRQLDAPLDVETPVHWAAFANRPLKDSLEPILVQWFSKHGYRPNE